MSNDIVKITQMPALVALPKSRLGIVFISAGRNLVHWAQQQPGSGTKFIDMGAIANGAVSSGQVSATAITFNNTLYVFYQGTDKGLRWATLGDELVWDDHGAIQGIYTLSTVSPLIVDGWLWLAYQSREGTLMGLRTSDGKKWEDMKNIDIFVLTK
jgi:hypothetical protein